MNRFRKILNLIVVFTSIFMLITVIGMKENSTYTKDDFDEDFSEGWTLSQPDGSRSEMTFPYDYPDGNPDIQIVRTLPQVPDHAVLLVMGNYKSMTAYVDGEEIFHALPSVFGMVKTDMGHYVALIPLNAEHSGKEIALHITERSSGYRSEIQYIRLTSAAQYGFQILEENSLHLIFSIVMLVFAAVSLGAWLVLAGKNTVLPKGSYHSLLWIALFAASIGTWFFTEAYVWAISAGTFAASGTLSYIALSMMPVSLLGVFKSVCTESPASLRRIVSVAKIMLVTEWALFLTGLADFSEMLILLHAECVVAVGIVAVFMVWKRELFFGGGMIRYGAWALLGMVLITVVSYCLGKSWLLWALATALFILASVMISTFVKLSRTIKDIAQTKQYKEYALTDIMTGLQSRYAYTVFEARQKIGLPSNNLHLVFLDIDKLKETNDTLGHAAGDEMIVAASKCIKDAFGDVAECFRMGGDEFLVAMTAETEAVRERIALFDRLISRWSGRYVNSLTISYGVAAANEYPGMNFEELLKTADNKMYRHKKHQNGQG